MSEFYTEPKTLTISGVTLTIKPIPVKKLSKAAKYAAPLVEVLSSGEINPIKVLEKADAVISLCALLIDVEESWVGDLNSAELIELLTVIVSVNMDFFSQTLAPTITALMKTVSQASVKLVETPMTP